jgi:hypothetical protein
MPGDQDNDSDPDLDIGLGPYRTSGVTTDPNKDGRNPALNLLEARHVDDLTQALKSTKTSVDKLDTTIQKFINHVISANTDRAQQEKRREEQHAETSERLDRIEAGL